RRELADLGLTWTKAFLLLQVNDERARSRLLEQVLRQRLTCVRLKAEIYRRHGFSRPLPAKKVPLPDFGAERNLRELYYRGNRWLRVADQIGLGQNLSADALSGLSTSQQRRLAAALDMLRSVLPKFQHALQQLGGSLDELQEDRKRRVAS